MQARKNCGRRVARHLATCLILGGLLLGGCVSQPYRTGGSTRAKAPRRSPIASGPIQVSFDGSLTDGSRYKGGLKNGRPHGRGTRTWPDGMIYTGQFQNGAPHGRGTLTFGQGQKYVGAFQNGKLTGQAAFYRNGALVFEGGFLDGHYHGYGTLVMEDGSQMKGFWENGDYIGQNGRMGSRSSG
jgi:hypothetical protein